MIEQNLQAVSHRIQQACAAAGRSTTAVQLLAVSKTFGPEAVRQAAAWGQLAFGENYVQEALDKMQALQDLRDRLTWHFIGALQSNKTRAVATHFDWVHSIDRVAIAQRLNDQRPAHLPRLQVLVQVNTSQESSKNGVDAQEVANLAHDIQQLPRLQLRGLMALPAPSADPQAQRAAHQGLRQLFESLQLGHPDFDTLSMGMSADLEAAIAEGSTMVRVGTAIFGQRPSHAQA